MGTNVILNIRELKKSYGEDSKEASPSMILKGITVQIYKNDFTVIMGSSGSGKSTFLYCVSGMDSVTSGSVSFNGIHIEEMNETRLAELRRKGMGFVFQQMNLLETLTLYENITVPAFLLNNRPSIEITEAADKLMRDFGIECLKNRRPNQVSGGQLQRAAIARAMINNPDIIFADEPTGALNSVAGNDVLDILSKCGRDGQSILMVTHDINAAMRADRIIFLNDGNISGEKRLAPYQENADNESRKREIIAWLNEMGW